MKRFVPYYLITVPYGLIPVESRLSKWRWAVPRCIFDARAYSTTVTDFVERLRAALGASYDIQRELGGGGMSRVFVAHDIALDRPVVIKLLHPELAAGVNVDRFKREVQLLARLQHPHIVPILSAGEVDGLPYYVMPFVRGQSLRVRLESGPLPPSEAAGLLADVAKALGAAHAEGVVHRDIKPDNILISGGAAVVADFGIAKALSSARLKEDAGTLTSLGTSLGTPAYMAPEQVAGDPTVDHRADLYSLGCVAYEALTGSSPFAGKTPQQMLAAQVIETPAPIASRRAGIPPGLAAVVMRCLEKEPANRPQSAAELAALLDASTGTDPRMMALPRPSRASRRSVWAAVASVIVITLIVLSAYRWGRTESRADAGISVAVAPFDVLDPRLALWKEGMVDVLSRNVDGAGSIRAISPSVAIKRWEGRADRESAVAFAHRVDAQVVLYGQLQSVGGDLVDAKVWIENAQHDAAPIEVDVRDSATRMDRITDSLSVRLLSVLGREYAIGPARLASLGSGSLPAIKAFLQGSQYFRRTQWDSAVTSFQEAVALDTNFAIAYGMLGQSLGWTDGGRSGSSIDAYARAGKLIRPGLSPRDSLLIEAMRHYGAARNGPSRANELREAFAAAGAAVSRYPNDAHVLYVYADLRYHGDPTLSDEDAAPLFDRAVQADSEFAPAWVHAVELSYLRGADVGRRYTQLYLARNPRDAEARGLQVAAELANPALTARERASIVDTVSEDVGRRAWPALLHLADSAESVLLLGRASARSAPPEARRARSNNFAYALAMRGHVSEAWSIVLQNPNYLAGEIAGLGLIPPDSAARIVRPWLARHDDASLAPIPVLALVHDTATLVRLANSVDAAAVKMPDPNQRAMMSYFSSSARAYAALARNDTAAATRLFDALPDSLVTLPLDQLNRARLVERTDPRRALELLRGKSTGDLVGVARTFELGRVAERLGQRQLAVESYARVADLWRNTDSPQLRDARDESRAGLQRLDSDGRLRAETHK
jgi:serine/threonine-protein kinase